MVTHNTVEQSLAALCAAAGLAAAGLLSPCDHFLTCGLQLSTPSKVDKGRAIQSLDGPTRQSSNVAQGCPRMLAALGGGGDRAVHGDDFPCLRRVSA
jgi:hypothetical protein